MITRKSQLLAALREGDRPEDLVCFIQHQEGTNIYPNDPAQIVQCRFDELPDREFNPDFGGTRGEPCIAFSKRFVYICVQYDGSEWMEAIPRHPSYVREIPWPGGG